jgi:hypothetical protein
MTIEIIDDNPLYLKSIPDQSTPKSRAFQRWYDGVRNLLDGKTPEEQKIAYAMNQKMLRGLAHPTGRVGDNVPAMEKALMPSAVHVDTLMSEFSTRYANSDYIGEQLMPVVTVALRSNKFATYPKREQFAYPTDNVGPDGQVNEIVQSRTTDNYSVKDYGLKSSRDLTQIANQDAPYNELLDMALEVNSGIAFNREKRIFAIVFASGSYGSNTAGPGTIWDTATTGGSIVTDIMAARAALWNGLAPTRKLGFCTIQVWNGVIAANPAIRDLFKYQSSGLAVTTQLAQYFRLDDILITEAREDTANIGQTASYARMTTQKAFGIIAASQSPSLNCLQFGTTFRVQGDPYTTQWMDPSVGARGSLRQRVSVAEDHKIVAADAGYYITAVMS